MIKTPKIKFTYSWIYDKNWEEWVKIGKGPNRPYPSIEETLKFIEKIKPIWTKKEKKILTELSNVTKLNWSEKEVKCYVVGRCRPFSDPLTMPADRSVNRFLLILIHELIHQIFIQSGNLKKKQKYWHYLNKRYKGTTLITRIHIPVHAFLKHLLLTFYTQEWVDSDIEQCKKWKDYKKAWDIVEKEGYKSIIAEFIKRNR